MSAQLRLTLEYTPSYERAKFLESDANAAAVSALDAWPAWPGGALALVGPEGSGKTHLAMAWALRTHATIITPDTPQDALAGLKGPAVWEDADRRTQGETLFHLINIAGRPGGGLLITARTPPSLWRPELPDLRSRLNALVVTSLHEPDDLVLAGLLLRFFQARSIRPSEELLAYLVRRIERSAPTAQAIVAKLDETAHAEGRPISRVMARQVLDELYGDDAGEVHDQGKRT